MGTVASGRVPLVRQTERPQTLPERHPWRFRADSPAFDDELLTIASTKNEGVASVCHGHGLGTRQVGQVQPD